MTSAAGEFRVDSARPWDPHMMQHCFELADAAQAKGGLPFAACLVDRDGRSRLQAVRSDRADGAQGMHAEVKLLQRARNAGLILAECILYSSAEPCENCTRAIAAAGVGGLVYGVPMNEVFRLQNRADRFECREVLRERGIEVTGPVQAEAGMPALEAAFCKGGASCE